MKKTTKKLALTIDTVRTLAQRDLRQAQGAKPDPTYVCDTAGRTCDSVGMSCHC